MVNRKMNNTMSGRKSGLKRKDVFRNDTIAAIATPVGEGGISVLRLSGNKASRILKRIFKPFAVGNVDKMATHTLYYGVINVGALKGERVLSTIMYSPHSYTGEDVVEISAHGGMLVVKNLLEQVLKNGARMADPGEFTKRSFLNGKMDLIQAEAVADIIYARTDKELAVSISQLGGNLSTEISDLKRELLDLLAQLEADIDYGEEGIEIVARHEINRKMKAVVKRLGALRDSYQQGKILKKGIKMAIIGKPNVGKSSMLNCLLKEEKAIVTAIPGTTRDIVEEFINIRNIPVHLLDTAGLRPTDDEIEKKGLLKTEKAIEESEMVLWLVDGSANLAAEDIAIRKKIENKPFLLIINKSDLPQKIKEEDARSLGVSRWITFSTKTKEGVRELEKAIEKRAWGEHLGGNTTGIIITNQRHYSSLQRAFSFLQKAIDTEVSGMAEEFISLDLRKSIEALSEIVGEFITDEILDAIFAKFCVGK